MMQWLSHQQPGDDVDATNLPETPAPLFALRAFRSTIFGSPDVNHSDVKRPEDQHRVEDSDQDARDLHGKGKGTDPIRGRTRTPTKSPAKSILVTPGTRKSERKVVAFRDAPPRITTTRNNAAVPAEQAAIEPPRNDDPKSLDPTEPPEVSSPTPKRNRTSRTPLREIDNQNSPSPKQRQDKSILTPVQNKSSSDERRLDRTASRKTQPRPSPKTATTSVLNSKAKETTTITAAAATATSPRNHHHHRQRHVPLPAPISASKSTRDQRHLLKLLHRYEIVKQYAKMKDDEANDLALRVRKLEDENRALLQEVEQLKGNNNNNKPLYTNASRSSSGSGGRQVVGAKKNEDRSTGNDDRGGTATTATAKEDPAAWMVPRARSTDRVSSTTMTSKRRPPPARPVSSSKSPAKTRAGIPAAAVSAKVPNLPPDRLAAAKARLKVKAEERKRRAGGG